LRGLDALYRDAALGGEIELDLIDSLEAKVDVAEVRARFPIEALKIPADRIAVGLLRAVVDVAPLEGSLDRTLRALRLAIGNMKRTDASH
jgi:hypothetical protein